MTRPMISVVIPVYQAETTLARCVDSVLTQSMQDFEIILVDDGSADSSPQICDDYAARDKRIRVIHQKNAGVSAARNAGIQCALGRYLLFLDSDDYLTSDALSIYGKASGAEKYDVVIAGLQVKEKEKPDRKIGTDEEICAGIEIWERICTAPEIYGYAGGKMIRTDIVRKHGIAFNKNMRSQEDLGFFLSAYRFCSYFHVIGACVYCYDYAPSVRRPVVWDYLANQIKMVENGRACTALSQEAVNHVYERVLLLLYTGLYDAAEQGCYDETVERISKVNGLVPLLNEINGKGEKGFIARCFAAGKYKTIRQYLFVRNRIRDAVRWIRGAGKA